MTRIVINITDDSIGCENRPADTEIEVRDYRDITLQSTEEDRVFQEDGRSYVRYLFNRNLLEIWR